MAESRDWTNYLSDMRRFCVKVMIYSEGYGKERRIAGLRDVLAHAYFSLEDDTLWQEAP